jgi:hypothetical protein
MCRSIFFLSISLELKARTLQASSLPILAGDSWTIGSLGDKSTLWLLPRRWLDLDVWVVFDLVLQVQVFLPQILYLCQGLFKLFPQPAVVLLKGLDLETN